MTTSPACYRGMTREELDHQYAPSKWSIRGDDIVKQHCDILCKGSETERKRHSGRCEINTAFSNVSPNTTVDIFYPEVVTADTPVSVYIHGGYWVLLSKDDSSWFGSTVTSAGAIHVAVCHYTLAATYLSCISHPRTSTHVSPLYVFRRWDTTYVLVLA